MAGPDRQPPKLIVGIGASAGGLAAFKSFLSKTPADTGMGFVLVQHLDPHHKSLLVELLGANSPIPVVAARDGLAVKENCVFVIPPDATLTIKDGVLQLTTPAPAREHRRPIDTFFASLAEDCGERAVGIVLSGVGSDGTIGIKTIKEHGGLTLAQAEFDATALQGMPSSAAATGLVDHVVPVEAMAAKLIGYHQHLGEVAQKKDGDGNRKDIQEHLANITSLLHARSQHDFSGYKEATLIRRLQRRMQVLHIDSAIDYIERLRTDRSEIEALFQELLIGVTRFFRDPEAFDALKAMGVVPLLSAKGEDEPIRVWVPGCSTGEEVYSIAILLREVLQTRSRIPEVKIFGTDIDANAVAIARIGRYRLGASGVSPERFEQWFARDGEDYCPVAEIRDMCVFSTHSLVKDPPFSRLDLISCRNVLIYLDEELQDRLMRTFHYALVPGGRLFLGTAESVTRNSRLFTALDKKHRILQRRDTGAALPAFQPQGRQAVEPLPSLPVRRHSADDRIDKAVDRVMQHYAPAYFVIDRQDDVTRFSGAETRHYLEPSQGAASLNLFSIVHKSLRSAVRAAVSQARAAGHRVIDENLTIRIDGIARALTLIVEPIGGENGAKTSGGCVVAFRDTSPLAAAGATEALEASSDADVQALERELLGTKAQLQATTDELETHIQDMKSATEEFQAVNEELQSSNEELETSKEEMQSVNEELQTINSELNNKNELLTRLNSDVQNLLESTQIATVFLDDQLRIKHFTPTLTQLFPVRDSDRGRPITDFISGLAYTEIRADVEKVQREGTIVERDLALKDGAQVFVMRIRPYRTVANDIDGVVVTFLDITERKRGEEAAAHLAALVASSDDAIISKDLKGIIETWNLGAQRIFGYTAEEAIGKPTTLLMPPDRVDEEPGILARIARGEAIENYQTVRQRKDGSLFDVSLTVSPVRGAGGRIIGAAKIARDITERKRAEDAVRRSEERYRMLFDSIDEGFCVVEMIFDEHEKPVDYRFLQVSPSFEKQTGLKDAQGKRMRELAPHHEAHWFEIYGRIALTGEPARFQNRAEQLQRWYDVYAFRFGAPENRQVAVLFNDVSERKAWEARQALLTRELQHRTKNLLSVIQVIATQSLTNDRPLDEARQAFTARLHALAHSTELLTDAVWQGAPIGDVIDRELEAFSERVVVEGEPVLLNPNATQGFALAVHELSTNAIKYGALSTPDGKVAIRWSVVGAGDAARFVFRWQEQGGPQVTLPKRTSFGTTLLRRAIAGGERPASIDYAPEGLIYTVEAPLAAVAAEAWLRQQAGYRQPALSRARSSPGSLPSSASLESVRDPD